MKNLLFALLFLTPAFAQEPVPAVPLPWDAAELSWIPPTEYAAGGSLIDGVVLKYLVEALPPDGKDWVTLAILEGVTTYKIENLSEGLWTFRVRVVTDVASVSEPALVTKQIVMPSNPG